MTAKAPYPACTGQYDENENAPVDTTLRSVQAAGA